MSVLIEAISVVVKKRAIEDRFPGGMAKFVETVPNRTCCVDDHLVRVGFMAPHDVHDFVGQLETCGLVYLQDGRPADMVVVDQLQGPTVECDWVRLVRLQLDVGAILVACSNEDGPDPERVAIPEGWKFSGSLSDCHTFIPSDEVDRHFDCLSPDRDVVEFQDKRTGKKLYMGSPTQAARSDEFHGIQGVAQRALELEGIADRARERRDIKAGEAVFAELTNELLPRANQAALTSKYHPAFAHFACGLVLRVLGMLEEAIEQFRKSLSYSPDTLNTLLEITRCLGEADRPGEAKEYAQHAAEVDPSSPQAWGNLAMTLTQLKDESSARSAIKRALELSPEDSTNRQIQAVINHTFGENG